MFDPLMVRVDDCVQKQLVNRLIFNASRKANFHPDFHNCKCVHDPVHHFSDIKLLVPYLAVFELLNRISGTVMSIQFDYKKHEEGSHVLLVIDDQVDVPVLKLQSDALPRVKRQVKQIIMKVVNDELVNADPEHPESCGKAAIGESLNVVDFEGQNLLLWSITV